MKLLTAAGNGNGNGMPIRQWGNREIEHLYTLFVSGTFGGAAVTLEISPDGSTWFPITGLSITALGCINVEFRAPFVRAVVTGGAGPSIDALLL